MNRAAWRWGPAVVQMLLIFGASSIPDLGALPGGVSDHTGHFVGYALLGGLVLRALAGARWMGVTSGRAWKAWAFSVAYGASDETHQRFVHGRTAAMDDWAADALGAAVAVLAGAAMAVVMRRRGQVRDV